MSTSHIFEEVVDAASVHIVPDPADVFFNASYADTVEYIFSKWYAASRSSWDPVAIVSSPYQSSYHPVIYLHPPTSTSQHQAVTRHEMYCLLLASQPSATPTTWNEWAQLALRDQTRAYPCLCRYQGDGLMVRQFLTKVLAQSGGVFDIRAQTVRVFANQAFGPLKANLDLFRRVAQYRQAMYAQKQWRGFYLDAQLQQDRVTPLRDALRPLLIAPVVRTPAPMSLARGKEMRQLLLSMLSSRMARLGFAALFQHLLGYISDQLILHDGERQRTRLMARFDTFNRALAERQLLLETGDDETSIATLAAHYTCQSPPELEGGGDPEVFLDMTQLWSDAELRLALCRRLWAEIVITPTANAVIDEWRLQVPHLEKRAEAERAAAITATLKADIASLVRPSHAEMPPTPTQLQFRRTSVGWWHRTQRRAQLCGCARTQHEYAACMLQHLTALAFAKQQ